MKFRKIRREDIETCLNWYNYYIENSTATFETEPLSLQEFASRIEQITARYPWIVMETEEGIVGYAYLSPFMTRSAYDWTAEVSLYLDQKQRYHGYGKLLFEEIIRIAREEGYRNLISVITSENKPSMSMHDALGFVKSGEYPSFGFKFGRWLGVSCYTKVINDMVDGSHSPFSAKWSIDA